MFWLRCLLINSSVYQISKLARPSMKLNDSGAKGKVFFWWHTSLEAQFLAPCKCNSIRTNSYDVELSFALRGI